MKNISLFLLVFLTLSVAINTNSISQNANCTPDYSITDPDGDGVRHPRNLPIAFRNEYYHCVMTIIPPEKARTWGFDITITKIQISHLANFPTGLNWQTNSGNSDDYLSAPNSYCMVLDGVPTSQAGIFQIKVYANAWIRIVFEASAPGNPQYGGDVTFTLCNSLNLDLGQDRIIAESQQITLSANQNTNFHTYLWDDNSTNPTRTINGYDLGIGVHEISVTVFDTVGTTGIHHGKETNCYKTASITVTVTEDLSISNHKQAYFEIFPNPSRGNIIIKQKQPYKENTIIITNSLGIKVYSSQITSPEHEIDLSHLPCGTYVATFLENGIFKEQRKFIMQK